MVTLYDMVEECPQLVTVTEKEDVAALVGVPESVNEIAFLEDFFVIPAGRLPEEIDQAAVPHPLLVVMTAESGSAHRSIGQSLGNNRNAGLHERGSEDE